MEPQALLFPPLQVASEKLALRVTRRDGTTLSHNYANLVERAAQFEAHLCASGLSAGDRIGIYSDASEEFAVALLGAISACVVVVPLNPKLGPRELAHVLSDSGVSAIYCPSHALSGRAVPAGSIRSVSACLLDTSEPLTPRAIEGAPLFVLYTSGTTGLPKGAIITDTQVAANLDALTKAWAWTKNDVVVHALPLFHVHGLVLGLLGSLRVGGALHVFERFDPEAIANALAGDGTMLFAVPTMHHRLAEAGEKDSAIGEKLKGARLLISGSAGLSLREHARLKALTGVGVYERYGLTETLIACAVPVNRDGVTTPPMPGTVGFPLDGVELRLVDEERRTIEARDGETIGQVALRGKSVFSGYLNRPEATQTVLDEDGWFYTGDLATRDARGAIRILGRRSVDLIKTGGYKVGAGEIEALLLEVDGVRECAVVGVPDEDLGQRIEAFLVMRDGASADPDELINLVAKELTPHKRPRAVHFVSELPKNAMGKVQKKRLVSS